MKNVEKGNKNLYKDIKFTFYGVTDRCNCHDGIITIAAKVNGKAKTVQYGVAYCSPKDVYDKNLGKKIAFNFMMNELYVIDFNTFTHHGINICILADIVAYNEAPSWAKEQVEQELAIHIIKKHGMVFEGVRVE